MKNRKNNQDQDSNLLPETSDLADKAEVEKAAGSQSKEENKGADKNKKESKKEETKKIDPELKKYAPVSLLAKKFADSYGLYSQRTQLMRVSLANLVGECISWVNNDVEERQPFLTYVTSYFISKLDGIAATRVLEHFNKQLEDLNISEKK